MWRENEVFRGKVGIPIVVPASGECGLLLYLLKS